MKINIKKKEEFELSLQIDVVKFLSSLTKFIGCTFIVIFFR